MTKKSATRPAKGLAMPDEHYRLITTGVLTPEQQTPPIMKCADCKERPMTLIWLHPPVTEAQLADRHFVIPGSVWGKDVTCVCACCSFAGCPHREQGQLRVMK